MGDLFSLVYYQPWGLLLRAVAIVHFFMRRPAGFWFWVIILVPFGSVIYLVLEVIPDLGLLRHSLDGFTRRKRIRHLEALVQVNPAVGNLEELGDLYLDEKNYSKARDAFNKAIADRGCSDDAFYRRGIASIEIGDFTTAVTDLEYITSIDRKYDLHRAIGLLAHAYANSGQVEKAEACFEEATRASTLSETYLNYAEFLASQGRKKEAREWAERVLQKKTTMPNYLRRRERPLFRKAKALLKRVAQK
jgi:hypothetical protein